MDFRPRFGSITRCSASAIVLATVVAGCTPVSLPDVDEAADGNAAERLAYDPAARRLQVGDAAPDFGLIDARGRATSLSAMRGSVLVLAFYTTGAGGDEMLRRLGGVDDALVDRLAEATRVVAVRLDRSADAMQRLRADAERFADRHSAWTFVRPADEAAAALTGAFGIAAWESGDGAVRHTYNTIVLDRRGRIIDHFPGLDRWRDGDLIAAISAAADR